MDWSTVLASTGVSAVVGAVVSLFAVSTMTVKAQRAERREGAREALGEVVAPLLLKATRYRAGMLPKAYRDEDKHHGDDFVAAAEAWEAGKGLGAFRSRLFARRCRLVFGKYSAELAKYVDTTTDRKDWQALSVFLPPTNRKMLELWERDRYGLLHKGYRHEADSREMRKLIRNLKRLADGR